MNEQQIKLLANELAKNLKTPEDLNQLSRVLKKITVEAALNTELTEHLGYKKNQPRKAKIAEMVIVKKPCSPMREILNSTFPEIVKAPLNPKLLRKIKLASRVWMSKSLPYMPKG
ncbi:hypothetical protein O1Q81_00382 [Lonepinella sp. MS14436]